MSLPIYFRQSIVALSWFALPVAAQSVFTVAPSEIPGIRVDGPETAEFAKHISDLGVDATTRIAVGAPLSRAILVTNTTNRPVAKFVVRFEYLNPSGRMIHEIQWQEAREGFAPGASRLITVSRMLAEGLRGHFDELAVQSGKGSLHEAILRSPLVRAAVDSVLFADGDFYGPDVSGSWASLVEEQQFVRATRIELERIGPDLERIQRKLNEINKPRVERKPVPGEGLRIGLMRDKMFGELTYAMNGGYESFRAALEARFGEQSLPVLKRKF